METFDVSKTIEYWLESAEYDLETARSLMASGRFPHALFFGHLAIEKLLKAIYVKQNKQHAPYLHSLKKLAEESDIKLNQETLRVLAEITRFNIEARYPEFKTNLYKIADQNYTAKKFKEIEEIYKWFQKKL